MANPKGPFIWLAKHPTLVLVVGGLSTLGFFALSFRRGNWTWFPRGGALMALSGFIVSVQEALMYEPYYPASLYYPPRAVSQDKNFIRFNSLGAPVFNPDSVNFGDVSLTPEELEKARDDWEWEVSHDTDEALPPIELSPAKKGHRMRDFAEMTPAELIRLRIASIFGILGTFIWAFGDLVPRVTKFFK